MQCVTVDTCAWYALGSNSNFKDSVVSAPPLLGVVGMDLKLLGLQQTPFLSEPSLSAPDLIVVFKAGLRTYNPPTSGSQGVELQVCTLRFYYMFRLLVSFV